MDLCEIEADGGWKLIDVATALGLPRNTHMRCPNCHWPIRVHKEGTTGQRAHFEHTSGQTRTGCLRGPVATQPSPAVPAIGRIALPDPVRRIYQAVAELEAQYPGRKFTPDGHLVGSIGEVIAAQELKLTLHPMSQAGHDAYDTNGQVQIKMTGGNQIAMYATCERLVVLRVIPPGEAEIVYDGSGEAAWSNASKPGKNGQRVLSLARLRQLGASAF